VHTVALEHARLRGAATIFWGWDVLLLRICTGGEGEGCLEETFRCGNALPELRSKTVVAPAKRVRSGSQE